ncbi:uncharacterized protein [Macrobrachium rosenbergii]|uniref:uncharacterized protein n=1 Tax=Macrobrachium rosenbergii TaxID=79674 RepID=UPI0034D629A8
MLKRIRKGALRTPGALAAGVAPYAKPPEADGPPSGSDAVVLQLEADELVTESELEEEEEDLALVYESDPAAAADDNSHEGDADDDTEGTPEGDDLDGPTGQGQKKNPSVILSEENERLVGEWLETEAEFIYNKGLTAYKDKAKVWRAFEEKGQLLVPPVSGCEVRTWFTSLRSRFGRLMAEKNGQGTGRRLTDREKWILNIFHFLKLHIVHQRKPKVLGLPMAACAAAALPVQALDLPAAPVSSPAPTPMPSPSPVDPASTKARKNQVSEVFDVAFTKAQALRDDMLTNVQPAPRNPHVLYWRKFFQEVEDECTQVSEQLSLQLKMEMLGAIQRYIRATKEGSTVPSRAMMTHTMAVTAECQTPAVPASLSASQQQQTLTAQQLALLQAQLVTSTPKELSNLSIDTTF